MKIPTCDKCKQIIIFYGVKKNQQLTRLCEKHLEKYTKEYEKSLSLCLSQ